MENIGIRVMSSKEWWDASLSPMNSRLFKLVLSLGNKPKKHEVELLKMFARWFFLPLWKISVSGNLSDPETSLSRRSLSFGVDCRRGKDGHPLVRLVLGQELRPGVPSPVSFELRFAMPNFVRCPHGP